MKKLLIIAVLLLSAQFAANAQYEIQLAFTSKAPSGLFIVADAYCYLPGTYTRPNRNFNDDYYISWEISCNSGKRYKYESNEATPWQVSDLFKTSNFSLSDTGGGLLCQGSSCPNFDFPVTITAIEYYAEWDPVFRIRNLYSGMTFSRTYYSINDPSIILK